MNLKQLASGPNLKLAWRRITTGGNQQYKNLYRQLYLAYEVALEANLRDLRERLLGRAFEPCAPERIYVPKASGLHRPLSLLTLEDQIVLQAFANLAAKVIQRRRTRLQFRVVFSNILEKPNSIFFFRRWQETYGRFQDRVRRNYDAGRQWVGDFDLAAFYDTVSHELLLRTIYPRTTNQDLEWFRGCLRIWSSEAFASGHGHGLPQGPLASDFLAECFLLPIDLALQKRTGYLRYVDDVRLFGASEDEVRRLLIELERHCRERGLIPQTGKFAIRKAESVEDAMGMLPSISDPQHEHGDEELTGEAAYTALRSAVDGKPFRVVDKTRLRFALYRARPDAKTIGLVLRLLPHHPEHADAFFFFLGKTGYRKAIERLCEDLVAKNPYAYVRGEAWHVLARYRSVAGSRTEKQASKLNDRAVEIAKNRTIENFMERWGASHFLCEAERASGRHVTRFLKWQSPLVQAFAAPVLPDTAFAKGEAVEAYLRRTAAEPGLSVCAGLVRLGRKPSAVGLHANELRSQVCNTLRELGLIASPGGQVDPIGEILNRRYGQPLHKSWRTLLKSEYLHALGVLKQAEAAFLSDRSYWLISQNAFNQITFLALQKHLAAIAHAGQCKTIDKNGEVINFGVTVQAGSPFDKAFPVTAGCFRDMNDRRNRIPSAHPYEKKTAAQSRFLTSSERNDFVTRLRSAFVEIAKVMP